MPPSQITRVTWTDDDGSGTTGTIITNAVKNSDIYAKIDEMFAGGGAYATFTFGGLVAGEGAGVNSFAATLNGVQSLRIRNNSAGAAAMATLDAGNSTKALHSRLIALSSGYTSSGYLQADGTVLEANGAGGLSIACTTAAGDMRFYTGASIVERMAIDQSGVFTLGTGATIDAAFLARNTASDTPVLNGTTIDFDTEVYDVGTDFSADVFTAPTTGYYQFHACVTMQNTSGGTGNMMCGLLTTQAILYGAEASVVNAGQFRGTVSGIVFMTAGDTAQIKYYGAVQATVVGSNAGSPVILETYFCGRRVM